MPTYLEDTLDKADSYLENGKILDAEKIFRAVLVAFPESERAAEGFKKVQQTAHCTPSPGSDPSQVKLKEVIELYNQGRLKEVIQMAEEIILQSAPNIMLYNLIAAANAGLKNLNQAIENFQKSLEIDPQNAETYYNIGNIYNQKKDFDAEIESYKKALTIKPDYPEVYNNIGIALKAKGDVSEAIEQFTSAINMKPDFAEALYNLGVALQETGDLTNSIKRYKQAFEIKPNYFKAHFNMGNALRDIGDPNAAIDSYKEALKIEPDYIEAYLNIGNVLKEKEDLDGAIDSYNKVLKINPDYAEASYNLGLALQNKGELDAAIEVYKNAIKIKPYYADAYNNLGIALNLQGKLDAAIEVYKDIIKIMPDYVDSYNNLGNALKNKGDLDAAIDSYKKAIKLKPYYAEAHYNLGLVLNKKGELNAAIKCYTKAIKAKPDYVEAYNNLGVALEDNGEASRAIDSFNQALKVQPDYVEANFNRSRAYLSTGNFTSGWKGYECRWQSSASSSVRLLTSKPEWKPNTAGRVLLWGEQGLGDQIMFASLIPDLASLCPKLIVQVDSRLIPLFKRSFSKTIIYYPTGQKVSEETYDSQISMGSLPKYLRTDLNSFKKSSYGYLSADKEWANRLRTSLLSDGTKFLYGLAWRGGIKDSNMQNARHVQLSQLASFVNSKNGKLVSLQYGDTGKEIAILKKEFNIEVVTVPEIDNFKDIDGLSALTEACDVAITMASSAANLAGAQCKKTAVLVPFVNDWRWRLSQHTCYWYSSVRLFKQSNCSEWEDTLSGLSSFVLER